MCPAALSAGLAVVLLLSACQGQAPRPSPPPSRPTSRVATPPPGSTATRQPATAARIHDILQGMNAYGFNAQAPPAKGASQPGGLFINWRGTWNGDLKTADANTNIQSSGQSDQQKGSQPRHDPLTDIVYLRNLYAYQAIYPHDQEYAGAIARMDPIVKNEFASSSYYRCWVYFQLRDMGTLRPGDGWDAIASHFAAGVYQRYYDSRAGVIVTSSGSYRTDFAAQCGAMLIDAGERQHNAAWTSAGTSTLAHLLQRAQNPATHLFPLEMKLGSTEDTVAEPQLKMGEEAQLLEAFLDGYDLTGNKSYLEAVVQATNSLYSPAVGMWDRAHDGFFFAVDADGHHLKTAYKESRQAWMLPLLQHLARIEGGGVWAAREQTMLTVVRDKLWQPSIYGYPYRVTPAFGIYQSGSGVSENWVTSEAMGIACQGLQDQLLPLPWLPAEVTAPRARPPGDALSAKHPERCARLADPGQAFLR